MNPGNFSCIGSKEVRAWIGKAVIEKVVREDK